MNIVNLEPIDLLSALGMIAAAIALSLWQKLDLEGQLLFAAGRSILQLLIVGNILNLIFALNNPWAVLTCLAVMLAIATIVARNRIGKEIKGLLSVVGFSLLISCIISLGYAIVIIIQPPVWYQPNYLIPLMGMVLGNAMNGAALAGERLASMIKNNCRSIETHLCLGATPKQAIATYQKEAIRIGLIPTINQMMVVGMVSLPGMFTGQVLAGIDPLNAASYQILILFMIVLSVIITTFLVTEGVYRKFFNRNLQLIEN
jgi:putative ABC transport system permease protein